MPISKFSYIESHTSAPSLPVGSGRISHKVGELFCRVKSANVQQTVTHIPCKSKFFSIVALLKMGVCPNCTVLIGWAGDQPQAGTGGLRIWKLWGKRREGDVSRSRGDPLPLHLAGGGRLSEPVQAPCLLQSPQGLNRFVKSGRGNCVRPWDS